MSNRQYYARRSAGLCPDCGEPARVGVYCAVHRLARAVRVCIDRALDREGYNAYMRARRAANGKDKM